MGWVKCYNCGDVLNETELVDRKELHREIADGDHVPFETFRACPTCGDTDFEELETCEICGGPVKDWNGDICRDCFDALIKSIDQCVEDRLGEDIDYKDALESARSELFHYLFNN